MRLLLTADQLRRDAPGGVGRYVRGLMDGLADLGDRLDVQPWAPSFPRRLATVLWDLGLAGPPSGFSVVHATSFSIPPRRGTPMTAMIHDLTWRAWPDAYTRHGRRWHEASLQRAIESCDALFVPSAAIAELLTEDGVNSRDVHIATLGSDGLPAPDHSLVDLRLKALGIEGDFLLTVGTLQPRKNLRRVFAAYSLARQRLAEPLPLLVVGMSGWGERVEPVEGVTILQDVPDAELAGLYERCRLLVYAPLLEGFGLPVVEAMRAGAPVVASPVPSAGSAVLEVDPLDVEAIGDALVTVVVDDDVRTSLVARGREHVRAMTWRATARMHLDVWRNLA